jgi:multiple sugar transport system substrate-binding protein
MNASNNTPEGGVGADLSGPVTRRTMLGWAGVVAAATAASPLLAACSTSSSSTASSTPAAGDTSSATGTISIGSFQDPAMKPFRDVYVKQFQQETGITVNYQETSYDAWYQAAKSDGLNSTGAYDIYVMDDNWVPEFAAGNIIQNMDSLGFKPNPDIIEKGLEQGYWPPKSGARLAAFKNDSPALYALVIIDDVNIFYYNKNHFSSAPKTWDDIYNGMKTTANPPNLYGWAARGVKGNPVVMTYLPLLFSYGANFVNDDWSPGFAGPEGVAALERLLSFLPYMSKSTPEFDTDQETSELLQGKAMALTEYTGTAVTAVDNPASSKVVGQIDFSTTPSQVKPGPAIGTFIAGISSGAKNVEAAKQFLDWFTSDKIQLQFAQNGGNAAVTKTALTDATAAGKYRWLPAIADSVANSTAKPRTPDEPKMEDILGTELNLAIVEAIAQGGNYQQIAQAHLQKAADGVNALLQQNKSTYFG